MYFTLEEMLIKQSLPMMNSPGKQVSLLK